MNRLRPASAAALCLVAACMSARGEIIPFRPLPADVVEAVRPAVSPESLASVYLDSLAKDSRDTYSCIGLVDQLYNAHRRDLALKVINAAETLVSEPLRLRLLRIEIASLELDFPAWEALIRAEIETAISKNQPLDDSILRDPFFARLLPEYLAKFRQSPGNDGLYQLTSKATAHTRDVLEIIRMRLAAIPADKDAAISFIYHSMNFSEYDLLSDPSRLPVPVRALEIYPASRAKALIALHRPSEALAVLDKMEPAAVEATWSDLLQIYLQLGEKHKAAAIAHRFLTPRSHSLAVALAAAGDREAFDACIENLQPTTSAFEWYAIVDAADAFQDAALITRLRDHAEKLAFSSKGEIPWNVSYYYSSHGIINRFIDLQLPAQGAIADKDLASLLAQLDFEPEARQKSLLLLEKHQAVYGTRIPFMLRQALLLKTMDRKREALALFCAVDAAVAGKEEPEFNELRSDARRNAMECLTLLKDSVLTEAWIKEHPDDAFNLHCATEEFEKALRDARAARDAHGEFRLVLQLHGVNAAEAFVRSLPAESQEDFEESLLSARKDRAGLAAWSARLLARDIGSPWLNASHATALFQNDQREEARIYVRRALAAGLDFDLPPQLNTMGGCCFIMDYGVRVDDLMRLYKPAHLNELAEDLAPLLREYPAARAKFVLALANYFAEIGDDTRAIEAYQQAASMNPVWAEGCRESIAALQRKRVG